MYKRLLFIFYVSILSLQPCYSQIALTDSLESILADYSNDNSEKVGIYTQLAQAYFRIDSDKAIDYSLQAIELSKSLKFLHGEIDGLYMLSRAYWYKSDYDLSIDVADQGLSIVDSTGDIQKRSLFKRVKGLVYGAKGNISLALEMYFEALDDAIMVGDVTSMALCYNNIGFSYLNLGEHEKAIPFFLKAIPLSDSTKAYSTLAINYNNVGVSYKNIQKFDSALYYLDKALEVAQEVNFIAEVGVVDRSFAETYFEMGNIDKAQRYIHMAMDVQRGLPSKLELARSLIYAAKISLKKGLIDEALAHASEALDISSQNKFMQQKVGSLEMLYLVHYEMGNYQKAINLYSDYDITKDSLFDLEKAKLIANLELQNELDQKEKENVLLEKERQLALAKLDQRETQTIGAIIMSVLLGLSALIVFIYFRNSKRKNNLIEEQRDQLNQIARSLKSSNAELSELSKYKDGLTHMIAHDMKNSLSTILGLSAIDPGNEEMKLINQAGKNVLGLVTNMLDIQKFEDTDFALQVTRCNFSSLLDEAELQVEQLLKMKNITLEKTIPEDFKAELDQNIILRVLVNLLTNAIKYSMQSQTIKLNTTISNGSSHEIHVTVQDEGIGIEAKDLPHIFEKFWQVSARDSGITPSTGLGLTFCKLAVEAHGGQISAESAPGKGTTINLSIPVKALGN